MKRTVTAKRVVCPECKAASKVTCQHVEHSDSSKPVRIRYRKCPSCNHTFKTEQQIDPTIGLEIVTPSCPREMRCASRSSLTEDDVLSITDQLKKGFFSRKDLALQYGVRTCVIRDIDLGRTFKHLTAASS